MMWEIGTRSRSILGASAKKLSVTRTNRNILQRSGESAIALKGPGDENPGDSLLACYWIGDLLRECGLAICLYRSGVLRLGETCPASPGDQRHDLVQCVALG